METEPNFKQEKKMTTNTTFSASWMKQETKDAKQDVDITTR